MGIVDCKTEHLEKHNLESSMGITIGHKVGSDPVKDVIQSTETSLMYPEKAEINNDLQRITENSFSERNGMIEGSGQDKEVDGLIEVLFKTKLNPMAEEFLPQKLLQNRSGKINSANVDSSDEGASGWKRKNPNSDQKRRANSRTRMAQRVERIKRTVYVCDIDPQITEDFLILLFSKCGQIVDCRICIDPKSIRRIAFIEFAKEVGAAAALNMSGPHVGFYPIKVRPSRTAIAPINPTYLPRSESEREICSRTIYCKNIDKEVTQSKLKDFFQSLCGEVSQLKLLEDNNVSTGIAFVEFMLAESANVALNCSGDLLGSPYLRISPSKTPIRSLSPRRSRH